MSGNSEADRHAQNATDGGVDVRRIRICIVDDHPAVLVGLRSMLSSNDQFMVVGTFSSGAALLTAHDDLLPDVLLLDLRMPGLRGLECIAPVRERWPATRLLILSSFDMDEEIFDALEAGAHGFVRKSALPEEIDHAVRRVFAGKRALPADVAQRMHDRNKRERLTARELDVLRGVVRGDTSKEIALNLCISEFTVRNHVNSILAKLHARDRTEAAVFALKLGLVRLENVG